MGSFTPYVDVLVKGKPHRTTLRPSESMEKAVAERRIYCNETFAKDSIFYTKTKEEAKIAIVKRFDENPDAYVPKSKR